ncbi:MAG: hypothetical protein ACI4Q4_07235, partial [Oscillospiraceae bacterium]
EKAASEANSEKETALKALAEMKLSEEKLAAENSESAAKIAELEAQLKALRDADEDEGAQRVKELDDIKKQLSDIQVKSEAQAKEIKSLKKTNASLEKQLNEMMEDGQLTL